MFSEHTRQAVPGCALLLLPMSESMGRQAFRIRGGELTRKGCARRLVRDLVWNMLKKAQKLHKENFEVALIGYGGDPGQAQRHESLLPGDEKGPIFHPVSDLKKKIEKRTGSWFQARGPHKEADPSLALAFAYLRVQGWIQRHQGLGAPLVLHCHDGEGCDAETFGRISRSFWLLASPHGEAEFPAPVPHERVLLFNILVREIPLERKDRSPADQEQLRKLGQMSSSFPGGRKARRGCVPVLGEGAKSLSLQARKMVGGLFHNRALPIDPPGPTDNHESSETAPTSARTTPTAPDPMPPLDPEEDGLSSPTLELPPGTAELSMPEVARSEPPLSPGEETAPPTETPLGTEESEVPAPVPASLPVPPQWMSRVLKLEKLGNSSDEWEDAGAAAEDFRVAAVADGASEGIFCRRWADLLVRSYLAEEVCLWDPSKLKPWLDGLHKQWREEIKFPTLRGTQQVKVIDTGAAATFLGLRLGAMLPNGTIPFQAMAVGDSCLFWIRNNKALATFPLVHSNQFALGPALFRTRQAAGLPTPLMGTGVCEPGDAFILATDAVAKYLFEQCEGATPHDWDRYATLEEKVWHEEIAVARKNGCMVNDDCTLLFLRIGANPPT